MTLEVGPTAHQEIGSPAGGGGCPDDKAQRGTLPGESAERGQPGDKG